MDEQKILQSINSKKLNDIDKIIKFMLKNHCYFNYSIFSYFLSLYKIEVLYKTFLSSKN